MWMMMAGCTSLVAQVSRYADHSRLANGEWVKIRIAQTGIHELTADLLRQAGFSHPERVKIYGYGGALQPERLTADYLTATDDLPQVPICQIGGRRLFYATGPVNWSDESSLRVRNPYSVYGYYFLTEDSADEPLLVDSTTFVNDTYGYPAANDYHSLYEVDDYAWFHGGRNLYDQRLFGIGVARDYQLPVYSTDGTLSVCMSYTKNNMDANVLVNDSVVGRLLIDETTKRGTSKKNYPDSYSVAEQDVWEFPFHVAAAGEMKVTIRQVGGGDIRLDYIAAKSSAPKALPQLSTTVFPTPEYVEHVAPQDRHADPQADMVIIIPTTMQLLAQAKRLQALHEQMDQMRVSIVPANELYNEFASGTPDANAYRRYLKMLYDRAKDAADKPRYLVLFGDGAWDNRMLTSDWRNYSPDYFLQCYECENSFSETACYVADDYYTILDDNEGGNLLTKDLRDAAVGRLPAGSTEQAGILVDKIRDYRTNAYAGAWQNTICMMGDDGNKNLHMRDADSVVTIVRSLYPNYHIKKVYWDAYERTTSATGYAYPDASRLLRQQMKTGSLIMNYTGHGAPRNMSHERVLIIDDFKTSPAHRLPLWFTASCDIMPFDDVVENIGEKAMFNPDGGAIAFYGTTRTVYANYNLPMNQVFMKHVLGSTDGVRNSIGEAVRLAKNELLTAKTSKERDRTENKLQFTLLGDPALVLAAPTLEATIDSINGHALGNGVQRLIAGTTATVQGSIVGHDDFQGVVTVSVLDAEQKIVCRINDTEPGQKPDTAFWFRDRPTTIFVGNSHVEDGRFSFSFPVPKDVSYSDDSGLIQVYAVSDDKTMTAHGERDGFVVVSDNRTFAEDGPIIDCYLDSPTFNSGDRVGFAPLFYAEVYDEDGINVSGSGIGHDMELIIDGKMSQTYNLNDEFVFDFGSHQRGQVVFSIPSLSPGRHRLLFRVWDVLNNSSVVEFDFVVDGSAMPAAIQAPIAEEKCMNGQLYDASGRRVTGSRQQRSGLYLYRNGRGEVKKLMLQRQ